MKLKKASQKWKQTAQTIESHANKHDVVSCDIVSKQDHKRRLTIKIRKIEE